MQVMYSPKLYEKGNNCTKAAISIGRVPPLCRSGAIAVSVGYYRSVGRVPLQCRSGAATGFMRHFGSSALCCTRARAFATMLLIISRLDWVLFVVGYYVRAFAAGLRHVLDDYRHVIVW